MPLDRYQGLFDRLTDDEKESLPAPLRETLTSADRQLKDFGELLSLFYQRRVEDKEKIDRTKRRIEELKIALETAAKEDQDLRKDIDFEKKRIERMQVQCEKLQEKVKDYDDMIEKLRKDIEKTQNQNEWFVAKIAEYQLKVKELIEQKAAEIIEVTREQR
jgi:chromosome segregation ATPase